MSHLIVDSYKYRTRFTVNVDREILRKILAENLGMRKVSAEMVPQILSDDGDSLILVLVSHR